MGNRLGTLYATGLERTSIISSGVLTGFKGRTEYDGKKKKIKSIR
jgi:hypothetical protein